MAQKLNPSNINFIIHQGVTSSVASNAIKRVKAAYEIATCKLFTNFTKKKMHFFIKNALPRKEELCY